MTSAGAPDLVDLQFRVQGSEVAADHAELLWQAVHAALPWFADERDAGIHPLSGLAPGTGRRYLSRHARLTLRLPRQRVSAASALCDTELALDGDALRIGAASERELVPAAVLYAKFVTFGALDEPAFFVACESELAALGLRAQLVCGQACRAATPAGMLQGFSLMAYGLAPDDTVRLQRHGIGRERKRGCGLFLPHKSIAAVGALE